MVTHGWHVTPAVYSHTDTSAGLTFLDARGPDGERVIVTYASPRERPRTVIAQRLRD
jgi:hypothetical protein